MNLQVGDCFTLKFKNGDRSWQGDIFKLLAFEGDLLAIQPVYQNYEYTKMRKRVFHKDEIEVHKISNDFVDILLDKDPQISKGKDNWEIV